LKKNLNLDNVKQKFEDVHRAGLKTLAFFMIGNFADSRETVKDTIRFANSLNTDFATFTVTAPFPKTELYRMAEEQHLITNHEIGAITNNPSLFKQKEPVLRTPHLTPKMLRFLQLKAIFSFYLRPRQLFRILSNRHLARAFLSIEPASYSNNEKVLDEMTNRFLKIQSVD